MMDFALWFLTQLPSFLMAEPVIYFVGIFVLLWLCALFGSIIRVGR